MLKKPYIYSALKKTAKLYLGTILLIAVFPVNAIALSNELPEEERPPGIESAEPFKSLDLSNMVPEEVNLEVRLNVLEKEMKDVLDVSEAEIKYASIGTKITGFGVDFQKVTGSGDYSVIKLIQLRQAIEQENKKLRALNKTLGNEIHRLVAFKEEWLSKKKRWNDWLSRLTKEDELKTVMSVSARATRSIDSALRLIYSRLDEILTLQEKLGGVQAEANALTERIDSLIMVTRRGTLMNDVPHMLSIKYLSQFGPELWTAIKGGLKVTLKNIPFDISEFWILFIHSVLSLFLIIVFYRKRAVLRNAEHWRFISQRPISAGLFVGTAISILLYEYWGVPFIWRVVNAIIMGISFARLSMIWITVQWKRQFIYGLITVFVINFLMALINLPLPLIRLFMVSASLAGLYFCRQWVVQSRKNKDSVFLALALRFLSIFLFAIIILELSGRHGKAEYLFVSCLNSLAMVLAFIFFTYILHGSLEWLLNSSSLTGVTLVYTNREIIIRRMRFLINTAVGFLLLCMVLWGWKVYPGLAASMEGLLSLGFTLGSQRISLGLMILSVAIFYGSFIISFIIQKTVMNDVLSSRGVESGVMASIERLVHYAIIVAGFLLAISTLGFGIAKLTIILGALGVGIGFGLQGIVNNFVSGLIMLFERPIRIGDWIELGNIWAEVKSIGLRSTTIQTFDQADMIIPNTDLITNPVTNWTLTSRYARIIIPVGVAYGSDIPLVIETLTACARENPRALKTREPEVLFMKFGDSSLNFELRVWLSDVKDRLKTMSELQQEIDQRFRDAKIEIAFPQLDVHLKNFDKQVIPGTGKNAVEDPA